MRLLLNMILLPFRIAQLLAVSGVIFFKMVFDWSACRAFGHPHDRQDRYLSKRRGHWRIYCFRCHTSRPEKKCELPHG